MNNIIKKILPKPIKRILKKIFSITVNTRREYVLPSKCSDKQFNGKIVIIPGGGGGIGRGIALRLAAEGATIYLLGRTKSTLDDVCAEIAQLNGVAYSAICDIRNEKSVADTFREIYSREGKIDVLICCAGGSAREKTEFFHKQDISIVDDVININLRGTMLCCHAASGYMVPNKSGVIVTVSSIIRMKGKSKFSDYAAAKAGIIGFTQSLAMELAPLGIRVNCISPGKIVRGYMTTKSIDEQISHNLLGFEGTPEDVASTVAFLISNEAKFIIGQNIVVDGGRTLGLYGDK